MKKILMLAIAYIRKAKGQAVSFVFIVIMAASLLNIGLITLLKYNSLFDVKSDLLNTADVYFVMNEAEFSDEFYTYVANSAMVKDSELIDTVLQLGSFQYGDTTLSHVSVFMNADKDNQISNISYVEKLEILPDNPIYVPYVLKASAGYELGDTFDYKVGNQIYYYHIAGFFEEMMTVSPNASTMSFLLEEADFLSYRDSEEGSFKAKMINVVLNDPQKAETFISEVNNYMSTMFPNSTLRTSSSLEVTKFARTGIASIGSGIIIIFSMLIVFIVLILTHFRIKNSIEGDMKNIGALKSIGYTSNQLISAIIVQFIILAGVGGIVGIGISYGLLPFVRDLFNANSGMLWILKFDLLCFVLTLLFIGAAVIFIAYIGSKRIQKLPPITALRGGIVTHSFKKNVFPFDRVRGNINVLMALKTCVQGMKQNLMIFIIVIAVFFQMAFGGVFYYNAVIEEKNFINLVTGEIGDAILVLNTNNYDEDLLVNIQNKSQVRKAFYYDTAIDITFNENEMISGVVNLCEDYSVNENPQIYEGRAPIYENELALKGAAAEVLGKGVGDTLNLTVGNTSYSYLITGLMQDGNGLYAVQMTYKAYQQLIPDYKPTMILVYLQEGSSTFDFLEEINSQFFGSIVATQNTKEQVYSIIRPMIDTMKMSLSVIVVATLFIIALILHIVIKTNIIRRKTLIGIQKSIGFTTMQLMLQNTLALLPAFVFGSIVGAILSRQFMNQIAGIVMRSAGIMKVTFEIPLTMLLGMGISISLFAFLASMLISIRLRTVTAYSLIQE